MVGREKNEVELTAQQEMFCSQYLISNSIHLASLCSGYPLPIHPGNSYFVYFLCEPETNAIFYVGKGKGKRPYHHLKAAKSVKCINIKKRQAIRNIHAEGNQVDIRYFAIDLTEKDAFCIEKLVIKRVGRANLTNIASGFNYQTAADRASYQLSRIKKLSVICAEERSAYDIEMYLRIVAEYKKMAA